VAQEISTEDSRLSELAPAVRWLLVAAWMIIIFLLSHHPNSAETTITVFGSLNFIVRKIAHVSEFAILFALVRFALPVGLHVAALQARSGSRWQWLALLNPRSILAFVITLFYATSDEWHQMFVPGRSALLSDVAIDCSGALIVWCLLEWQSLLRKASSKD
jgi:VanZ family protein